MERRLTLRREPLAELTNDDLARVNGAVAADPTLPPLLCLSLDRRCPPTTAHAAP